MSDPPLLATLVSNQSMNRNEALPKKLKAEKMKTNGFRYGRGLKHGDTIRTHLNPFNDDWCVATAIRKLAEQTVLPGLPILVRCDEESASVYPPLHSSVLHFSHLVSAPLRPEE